MTEYWIGYAGAVAAGLFIGASLGNTAEGASIASFLYISIYMLGVAIYKGSR